MKTIVEQRNKLSNNKKAKKDLEKQLENKNLFNRRAVFIRIRILESKILKAQRKLKEFV